MAPVAGGISDGEENGFVLAAGFLKGRFAPRQPVHRIVGVLPKIGTLLVDERVGEGGRIHLVLGRAGHHFALRMSGGGRGGGHQFVDVLTEICVFGDGVPKRAAIG